MYHAHRYAKAAWPGEPEVDPTQEYEEREQVEGWELSPVECLESAYGGVLRERNVIAGKQDEQAVERNRAYLTVAPDIRIKYCLYHDPERVEWDAACCQVRLCFHQVSLLPVVSYITFPQLR